jgi:hypothetical protein
MAVSRRPSRLVGAHLEVRGHKSGRIISFPVVVADYQGERYLVAMLGQQANWVRICVAVTGGRSSYTGNAKMCR